MPKSFPSRHNLLRLYNFNKFRSLKFSLRFFKSNKATLLFPNKNKSFIYIYNGKKWLRLIISRWTLGFKLQSFIVSIQPAIYKKKQLLKKKKKKKNK